jgi:tetratricopeptide (TPR) repeat protein
VTEPSPPSPAEAGGSAVPAFTIADIDPPRYERVVLRGLDGDADLEFHDAMGEYSRGDYAGALPGLERATRLDPENPRSRFFLGASHLLIGQTEAAAGDLRQVLSMGETPYLEEAKLLLAQAHLVEGELEKARAELEELAAMNGDSEAQALRLLEQISGGNPARN